MIVTTLVKYSDGHTKIDAGIRLKVESFGVGGLYNNTIWVSKVDSNEKGIFPVISEFINNYCKKLNE